MATKEEIQAVAETIVAQEARWVASFPITVTDSRFGLFLTRLSDQRFKLLNYDQPSAASLEQLASFVQVKWSERAQELGREEPADLSGACKFVSLFVQKILGGTIEGNYSHQYNRLPSGEKLDLTFSDYPLEHDPDFFGNLEHLDSMASCQSRVASWIEEYRARTKKSA